MGNKEITLVIVILAVIFAFLSIFSDITITGYSVKEFNVLSLSFSLITIILIILIVISIIIELLNYKLKKN